MSHPSKEIIGTGGQELSSKKIALLITSSVAAYKSPDIARELMRHGAEVYAVVTPATEKMVGIELLEWATGNKVVTELTGKLEHIKLAGNTPDKVDLVLIAPATASVVYCLEPVFGTLFSIAFGTERLSAITIVGGVIIIGAVLIVARKNA